MRSQSTTSSTSEINAPSGSISGITSLLAGTDISSGSNCRNHVSPRVVVLPGRVCDRKARQEALAVQPQMAFRCRLAAAVLRPTHARGHQLIRRPERRQRGLPGQLQPWPARVLKPTSRTSRPASRSSPADSSTTPACRWRYRGIWDLTSHHG